MHKIAWLRFSLKSFAPPLHTRKDSKDLWEAVMETFFEVERSVYPPRRGKPGKAFATHLETIKFLEMACPLPDGCNNSWSTFAVDMAAMHDGGTGPLSL